MGLTDLQSGFSFITLAMALFALPEALYLVLDPKRAESSGDNEAIKDLLAHNPRRSAHHSPRGRPPVRAGLSDRSDAGSWRDVGVVSRLRGRT
jgi:hypothetical protein